MNNKTILGLDISSTTIGLAVIRDCEVLLCDYVKPNTKYNEYQQLQLICNLILDKAKEYEVDEVAIEQISEFFGSKSTSKTITKLAKWNAVISYVMFNEGYMINHYNVISIRNCIRKEYNIKNKTDIKKLAKEQVPDFLFDLLSPFKFEWEYNSKGKLKSENYDKADSLAVAYYHSLIS